MSLVFWLFLGKKLWVEFNFWYINTFLMKKMVKISTIHFFVWQFWKCENFDIFKSLLKMGFYQRFTFQKIVFSIYVICLKKTSSTGLIWIILPFANSQMDPRRNQIQGWILYCHWWFDVTFGQCYNGRWRQIFLHSYFL